MERGWVTVLDFLPTWSREKLCLSKHRHRRRIALEQFPSFPYALTRFVGAPFSLSLFL